MDINVDFIWPASMLVFAIALFVTAIYGFTIYYRDKKPFGLRLAVIGLILGILALMTGFWDILSQLESVSS